MEKEMDQIRKHFTELTDAALQEEYIERAGDYEPGGLALLKEELTRRGISAEALDELAAGARLPKANPQEPAVEVATFDSITFALEAKDLLEEHGIDAYIQGAESGVWGHESLTEVPEAVKLWVLEEDAEDAREILAEFPPALGAEGLTGEGGDEEE